MHAGDNAIANRPCAAWRIPLARKERGAFPLACPPSKGEAGNERGRKSTRTQETNEDATAERSAGRVRGIEDQREQSRLSGRESAGIKVERRQFVIEVDVEPFTTRALSFCHNVANERAAYPVVPLSR